MRLIAFYLPQYHPIPENDLWWGKGFTEWANVSKAVPQFETHYQPHFPADLGFYDLRIPEVREQQAELAREYGISGFCYYYYWFNGRRLLERPLDEILRLKRPNFPFCICWANEPWTRHWDGVHSDVLMPQEHNSETDKRFILDVLPILSDDRYIRINGRPLLMVYRTELFPKMAQTAEIWREIAVKNGVELYLCRVESFEGIKPFEVGFDAACEFPPNHLRVHPENQATLPIHVPSTFKGIIYDYEKVVRQVLHRADPGYKRFYGATPSWDNTPRQGARATIFINSSPDIFRHWLTVAMRKTQQRFRDDEQIVFINAWNEWAEGCYLEPDRRHGRALLEACKTALAAVSSPQTASPAAAWETYVPYTVL